MQAVALLVMQCVAAGALIASKDPQAMGQAQGQQEAARPGMQGQGAQELLMQLVAGALACRALAPSLCAAQVQEGEVQGRGLWM